MSSKMWTLAGVIVGFAIYFMRRVLNDPYALQDIAGTLGYASAGAFIGLIAGGVLGMIFGKKTPPAKD